MISYKEFRIEARHDHSSFKVWVKGWTGWKSGFIYTDYFNISYNTEEEARTAIEGYKARLKEIT